MLFRYFVSLVLYRGRALCHTHWSQSMHLLFQIANADTQRIGLMQVGFIENGKLKLIEGCSNN